MQKDPAVCRRRAIRRYIGDTERNCTSLRPYPITWCEGVCSPQINHLVGFKEYLKRNSKSYECVPDRIVKRKVEVFCADDQLLHTYRIKVIKTCKCKEVEINEVSSNIDTVDVKEQSSDNDSSISRQAKRFSHRLHNLQNRLQRRVQ